MLGRKIPRKDAKGGLSQLEIANHAAQWSAAGLGIIYLFGYLIEFIYFSSVGISDVGLDAAKLKYIESGVLFVLMFVLLGGIGFMLTSEMRGTAPRIHLLGSSWPANLLAILNPMSVVFAITLVPTADFITIWPRLAFSVMMLANFTAYLWVLKKINTLDTAGQDKWKCRLSIMLLFITSACDVFIFGQMFQRFLGHVATSFSGVVGLGVGFASFAVFAMVFFQAIHRLASLLPTLGRTAGDVAYAGAMLFVIIGLLYLSLTSYAFSIFPLISVGRGGANFCGAPIIQISSSRANETVGGTSPPTTEIFPTKAVVIYTTSETVFVADVSNGSNNPCDWPFTRLFPRIIGLPKTQVALSIGHFESNTKLPVLMPRAKAARAGKASGTPTNPSSHGGLAGASVSIPNHQ